MTSNNEFGWNLEHSYTELPELFFTKTNPTPVKGPKLEIFNQKLADKIGLHNEALHNEQGAAFFAGNVIPEGSIPLAQAYAGHQFGYFTRLGDGRAILLGEQVTSTGATFDIQLKGAGVTPYSRGGDGRAALGPMLREYIISEAMHALGIPTTRSLAVVTTGEPVFREKPLKGAILARVAASHIRVGTFQYASVLGSRDDLQALADYTIERHDKEVTQSENKYLHFLENVIDRQAELIAKWQLVGFIHGVMNTDNMTISGETIDYGPCAFMDMYNRKTVFSSIDREGRYAYVNQPYIGGWNLARFAETLLPLLHETKEKAVELANDAISKYNPLFKDYFVDGMRAKLGLLHKAEADEELIRQLLNLMEKYKVDYTNTFLALTFDTVGETILGDKEDFLTWHKTWQERRNNQGATEEASRELMRKSNPAVIPRNYFVEKALDAAVEKDDYTVFNDLMQTLSTPYAHTCNQAIYANVPDSTVPYRTYCGT